MPSTIAIAVKTCAPLTRQEIERQLEGCPCLPSLSTIDNALKEVLSTENRFTSQIAEIIQRDPSLTSRLLRLVNSVYYGVSEPVKKIEEAVLYLGVRQIRELAMFTPVIEDLGKLGGHHLFEWREFWRHSIAVAVMTREIMDLTQPSSDDINYLGGLIHDVGRIVMAATFPAHFEKIYNRKLVNGRTLLELEVEVLGMDHAELGALFLQKQGLPQELVRIVKFHHRPDQATENLATTAAVQVADLMVLGSEIGFSGNSEKVAYEAWLKTPGWKILFGKQTANENVITRASLKRTMDRLPSILEGLV